MILPRLFLLCLGFCAMTGAAQAANALDPAFGDGGMRHYGFQPINGGSQDYGAVACAGANGTLTMTGIASSQQRVVTIRLQSDGSYDPAFGFSGKASFGLPGSYNHYMPGLCQPDGHLVLARWLGPADGEQSIQILRVLKQTGQPDPSFGNNGVVDIDLDSWIPGLGQRETPLSVNALPNGDLAVGGDAQLAEGRSRGFIALLRADGSVRTVQALANLRSANVYATVQAPDGRLWAFGRNGRVEGVYRATLNRDSLAWEGVLEQAAPTGYLYALGPARPLDANTVVMPAATVSQNPGAALQLIMFRADSISALPLPGPPPGHLASGDVALTVLPGRRVLLSSLATQSGSNIRVGIHFAAARVGYDTAGDRLELQFGTGGSQLISYRAPDPACATVLPMHGSVRLTLWDGLPVLASSVAQNCPSGTDGMDYLVGRLRPDYLFGDGLD